MQFRLFVSCVPLLFFASQPYICDFHRFSIDFESTLDVQLRKVFVVDLNVKVRYKENVADPFILRERLTIREIKN